MLRISKLADYGTVIMVYLAREETSLRTARDISVHTHLAQPTVSKLLKRLTSAGLLISVRGVNGGYQLQRPTAEISIADIIEALEGKSGLIECSAQPNACSLHRVCSIQGNWRVISQAIQTALDSVSLAVLAKPVLSMSVIETIQQATTQLSYGE